MIAEAIILVGGKGTRLNGVVNDCPKPMAEVAGRPFLEWLLLALCAQGVGRIVLATGYKGELISEYFGDGSRLGLNLAYSQESKPLGTAGALLCASKLMASNPLLVLNGDSYCPFDSEELATRHFESGARATLWLVETRDCTRYGLVQIDKGGKVVGFREKSSKCGDGLVSAGIYLFDRRWVAELTEGRTASLEEEFLPGLVEHGVYAVVGGGPFVDIGTPESYAKAATILSGEFGRLEKAQAHSGAAPSHVRKGERARNHLLASAEVKQQVAAQCLDSILSAAHIIATSFQEGGKVLLCGNGGSAADCQHMATEFVGRLTKVSQRPGLPAVALTTDTSFLTAFANDYGFERVFERQVRTLGKPGDILIAISTSGNSANVIRAMEAARAANIQTIALTGNEGRLGALANVTIRVPATNTQYIQEAHLAIEHVLCDLVESCLFGQDE